MDGEQRQTAETQLRQQLEQMIEAARAEIEHAIAQTERTQHEGEGAEQIEALRSQLSSLDGVMGQIRSGSMYQLQMMQTALPHAIQSIRQNSQSISQEANYQIGQHITEVSIENIHALQLSHDADASAFAAYESQSTTRIDQLATAKGIDIAGYRMNRARLQTDIEAAKRSGDRPGQFKGEALLASNNVYGLIKTGGSDAEIDEAKTQAADARARYLREKEIEALHAGRAQGLSDETLRAHVDLAGQTAARELDAENARNAKRVGLTPEQTAMAHVRINAAAEVDEEEKNVLAARDSQSAEFSIQVNADPAVQSADRAKMAAEKPDMKALLAANGISPPTVGAGFENTEVDLAQAKQPTAAPDTTPPAKDGTLIL